MLRTSRPDYGFKYDETGDAYVVAEEEMRIVRRIFLHVSAGGDSQQHQAQTGTGRRITTDERPQGRRVLDSVFSAQFDIGRRLSAARFLRDRGDGRP